MFTQFTFSLAAHPPPNAGHRLEANDGVLVVTEQNDELLVTDPETARSERWLVVHPNYSVD